MSNKSPVTRDPDGGAVWKHQEGDSYVVTGVTTDGRRFPAIHTTNWSHAAGNKLDKGNRWLLRDGKRYLIGS